MTTINQILEQALEALDIATNGLAWYRDMNPTQVNECDEEADAEIEAAKVALQAALQSQSCASKTVDSDEQSSLSIKDGYQAAQAQAAHIDHPMRHYDRTCPACQATVEPVGYVFAGGDFDGCVISKTEQFGYIPLYTSPPTAFMDGYEGGKQEARDAAHSEIERLGETISRINMDRERMREAMRLALEHFHKLACLGNGDQYGNSTGNVIAQAAIAALEGSLK